MTGYVFHCSRCKVSHAGECPPEPKLIPATWYPAEGSRWYQEAQNQLGWKRTTDLEYEVTSFDHFGGNVVIRRRDHFNSIFTFRRAMWDDQGMDFGGTPYRFVPVNP